jgi:hypothetical protein
MTAMIATRENTTARNWEVANTILRQVGSMNRMCLDLYGPKLSVVDNGLIAHDVVVGRRKRGNIEIMLTPADLYDIKVTRFTMKKGAEVLRHWEGVYGDDLSRLLGDLWL